MGNQCCSYDPNMKEELSAEERRNIQISKFTYTQPVPVTILENNKPNPETNGNQTTENNIQKTNSFEQIVEQEPPFKSFPIERNEKSKQEDIIPLPLNKFKEEEFDKQMIACTLCSGKRRYKNILHHLDCCHYAHVRLIESSMEKLNFGANQDLIKQVICLLCGYTSQTLQVHRHHMQDHHLYMQTWTAKKIAYENNGYKLESNAKIKRRVVQISKLDYIMRPDGSVAEIGGHMFDVDRFAKDYKPPVDIQQVKTDLVWRYILGGLDEASFYDIDYKKADNNNIIARSRIFTKKETTL